MIENILCDTLETALNEQKNKCLVLYGPPGVGKTTNALNFAWYLHDKKHNWICLWFNAESKDTFMVDLVDLTDFKFQLKKYYKNATHTHFVFLKDSSVFLLNKYS